MISFHIPEKLAATNPECKVWLDRSPLVYETSTKGVPAAATRKTLDFVARALESARSRAA